MGVAEIKHYETYNASGDGNLWKNHFPELRRNVTEYVPLNPNLGHATISNNDYTCISSFHAVNN